MKRTIIHLEFLTAVFPTASRNHVNIVFLIVILYLKRMHSIVYLIFIGLMGPCCVFLNSRMCYAYQYMRCIFIWSTPCKRALTIIYMYRYFHNEINSLGVFNSFHLFYLDEARLAWDSLELNYHQLNQYHVFHMNGDH